jgi:hypothetical protein
MNKNRPHPSKGWGNVEVGDLVYYIPPNSITEMGIVLRTEGNAAVVYSYVTKESKLTRIINLLKVET